MIIDANEARRRAKNAPEPQSLKNLCLQIENAANLGQNSLYVGEIEEDWKNYLRSHGYNMGSGFVEWGTPNECMGCFWNDYEPVPCGRRQDTSACRTYRCDENAVAILCNAFGTHMDAVYREWMKEIRKGNWKNARFKNFVSTSDV